MAVGDPSNLDNMKHGCMYVMHSPKVGVPGLLISPQMLKAPSNIPGWFILWLNDERELYKFAASLMNKADELSKMREQGILPDLHEERDESP